MSLFETIQVACPQCQTEVSFGAVHSVNADRRPDFRQAILKGTFQRETCGQCGHAFRLEPQMTYLDIGRKQFILVRPAEAVGEWDALEDVARVLHAEMFGERAADEARELGRDLVVRVVFGWAALREKLLCAELGLDDVTLELVKLALLRSLDEVPLTDSTELRLAAVEGDELVFGWISATTEAAVETVRVPKSLYDEIRAAPQAWQTARDELASGAYVDLARLLVPAEEAAG
jgi:hypothetical protein